jgi:hypothetical protein
MEETHVRVKARYEERIRIKHLSMEPALQGATSQFSFHNHPIEIKLPQLPPNGKGGTDYRYLEAEADEWKAATGEILNVHIYTVSLAILALEFDLPIAAADHRHINDSLYSEAERGALDEKSDQLYFLARRAIDYWLRVVRWKTGLGLIDTDTSPDSESLHGGRLFNDSHGGAFYSPRVQRTVVAPERHRLTPANWSEIALALSAGATPPIWNEYQMSAHRRIEHGDLVAATIDLAIAAESVIRRAVDAQLPADTPNWTRNTVARINMSTLIDKWPDYGLPAVSQLQWFSTVKRLIQVRNRIMHRWDDSRIQAEFCRDAARAVDELIAVLAPCVLAY